ncbi:DUF308 domain-containing protein [Actinotalea ferrariae]|uniref:lipase family protein n=1 Tax=Actinotalea ferrariae TaxID=1386098 RepID=UPI001C8C8517|nr:lipase family protein [Actinotalea ferrariae]MBX9243715.1 DUF308 domain-containing protein [Actinotalea ferrariae]
MGTARSAPPWRVRLPERAAPFVGAAMVGLGVALLARANASVAVVVLLVAAGLVLAGIARLVRAAHDTGTAAQPSQRRIQVASGLVLVAAGVLAVAWSSATVRVLVLLLALGLAAAGVAELTGSRRDDRATAVPLGLASLALAAVVLVWPRLSLWAVGVAFGAWLVLTGLHAVLGAVLRRAPRRRRPRRWVQLAGAAVALVVSLGLLAGSVAVHRGDVRVAPDGFYTPPLSVPDEAGALLRSEPLTTGVPDGARAWRILFTTTDGDGHPAISSGTVLAPEVPGDTAAPVIAVAHGTTGVTPRCAPSMSERPFADGAGTALERMVADGWVGIVPDYVGLGTAGPHPYLVGPDTAHAVLDGVRAARRLDLDLTDDVVVWGHSQGGHAALWTGMVAEDYAPDVPLLGVAALAPATDLEALAEGVRSEAIGKLVSAYIAASWAEVYPSLELREIVTPGYLPLVRRIEDLCFTGRDVVAALATASQMTDEVIREGTFDGEVGELLRANSPDGDVPVPVLLAQGTTDPLILPGQQRAFVAARCAAGQPLDYREYDGLDHLTLVAAESPLTEELMAWTEARRAGEPAASTCP